ncbi:MAG TPA: AtpZ/AtpI family protein [Thermoanaerobaculia bacterium]|jgi:ATP synthase protein I
MPEDNGEKNAKLRERQQLLEASSIGWMFPIAIGLGFLWGWGMDKLFGTKPWLTYIFTALGVAAAFVNLFKIGLRDSGGNE